jgi:hypothetical protein
MIIGIKTERIKNQNSPRIRKVQRHHQELQCAMKIKMVIPTAILAQPPKEIHVSQMRCEITMTVTIKTQRQTLVKPTILLKTVATVVLIITVTVKPIRNIQKPTKPDPV